MTKVTDAGSAFGPAYRGNPPVLSKGSATFQDLDTPEAGWSKGFIRDVPDNEVAVEIIGNRKGSRSGLRGNIDLDRPV
jgi:hypothetical protein